MMLRFTLTIPALFFLFSLHAQNYSAAHGSSYMGSLNVYNNPASIVNSPFRWDLTLLGMQYQTISNAVRGRNFPFNLGRNATFYVANGNYGRKADLNLNLKLLNGRYSIDKSHAFAFGANLRGYTQAFTSRINYTDSVETTRAFLFLNRDKQAVDLGLTASTWLEVYGSYGQTIWDREATRLTAGGTVKLMRSMSGMFATVNDVGVTAAFETDFPVYGIAQGNARYGYSANLGDLKSVSVADMFTGGRMGVSMDLGMELLIKTQAVTSVYDEGVENEYEWKVGVSLLDLGWNRFDYSNESRSVASLRNNVTSESLNAKFTSIDNISRFNDSVATVVNSYRRLSGNFNIINPARIVINIDRSLSQNMYLNAELSVSVVPRASNHLAVREAKLLTITPRWETRKLGLFFPAQLTRHGNFWIGGALKAGPLLLGTHNLLNVFSGNKYLSSGVYMALILHPGNYFRHENTRRFDCPEL